MDEFGRCPVPRRVTSRTRGSLRTRSQRGPGGNLIGSIFRPEGLAEYVQLGEVQSAPLEIDDMLNATNHRIDCIRTPMQVSETR